MPSVFMQNVIAVVEDTFQTGDWASASGRIFSLLAILVIMYIISLIAGVCYTQMMAIITQGTLAKLREKMFDHMQDLPIRYFDTHNHGDIMSYYTNDIDTLRQMISQSLPQMLISGDYAADRFLHHGVLQHLAGPGRRCGRRHHDLSSPAMSAATPPATSSSQQDSHRPHRGLYGGNDERPEGHQGLLP